MWKSILSAVSLANINTKSSRSFTRKSSWYCFQNPMASATTSPTSTSDVIVSHNSLNLPALLFYKKHLTTISILSAPNPNQRRYMSNSPTDHDDKPSRKVEIVVEGISKENINKAISLLESGDLLRNTQEVDNDVSEVLVNLDFFIQVFETTSHQHLRLYNLLKYLEWVCYRDDFMVTPLVLTRLVYIFSNPCEPGSEHRFVMRALWNLVKRVGAAQKGVVTTYDILDCLLLTCSRLHDTETAFEIFHKFEDFGCVPSFNSYFLIATSGHKHMLLPWELQFLQRVIDDGVFRKCDDKYILSFIKRFCVLDKPKLAHAVYLAAKDRAPVKGAHFLIRSLSKHDDTVCLAMDMLAELSSEARNKATVVFSSVIKGLCRKGDIDAAKMLLLEMIAKGPPPGVHAFTDIIKSLCKFVDLEGALEMLKLMESRGLKPNAGTYRLIFFGYQKCGMMEQASTVLSMAKNKHPKDQLLISLSIRLNI